VRSPAKALCLFGGRRCLITTKYARALSLSICNSGRLRTTYEAPTERHQRQPSERFAGDVDRVQRVQSVTLR
jgi:hypothetical protein